MSLQTDITQAVANLTNRLNAITEGAKKIFDLTWQSSLNPASEIHVSIGGVSQKINIQQIVDAILSFRQNQLLSIGTISVVDNDVTIPANAQWVINNVNYFNIADIVINVPYAADGYTRNDILVADTENNIMRIIGPETEGVSPTPNAPLNTVLVTTLDVTDSAIGYTPPVIGTNFELLENKQNNLTPDGSGVKYPTVDAIILALLSKADLVSGKVPQSQLPSYVDDVIEGYLLSNVFYVESGHTTVITAQTGKIYIDLTTGQNGKQYRYSGSAYIQITNGLIASTDDVPEGAKLYFTTARVLATVLSGISFATGGVIVSTDTILIAFGKIQKQITDILGSKQDVLVSGTNIKTINGSTLLGVGNLNTPDMDTSTAQTVSGTKTFLSGTLGLRNVANTFTSFFTNTNTTGRTYILQNRNGTLLDDIDLTNINASIATKQGLLAGITNYIPKSSNATTLVPSRMYDDGTFIGIGTINPATKDVTFGKQTNREIGIEQSDSATTGRDLTVSAGKTVNFNDNSNFVTISQNIGNNAFSIIGLANTSIYATRFGGDIYKQTNGTGFFSALGLGSFNHYSALTSLSNNNVYDARFGGDIYMQTAGTGSFAALSQTTRNWYCMGSLPSNNVYAGVLGGDIYMQTNGTGNFVALGQTTRAWVGLAGSPTGNMYAIIQTSGDIYMQTAGTGTFNPLGITNRVYSAITVAPNNNVYVAVANGDIYMQTNGTGSFTALGQTFRDWTALGAATNGNIYAMTRNGDIYLLQNTGTGASNLNGGALNLKAGSGKGTGQSRINFITGQKTVSGTDMQTEAIRGYIDENGFFIYSSIPVYANDAAADADANLPTKALYKVTGNRTIFQKP